MDNAICYTSLPVSRNPLLKRPTIFANDAIDFRSETRNDLFVGYEVSAFLLENLARFVDGFLMREAHIVLEG